MKESTPTPLQIPEIALSIVSHLDPPTILSIRLVSVPINTLILTHQKSISRSVTQRQFSSIIDCRPPDIDCLQKNFHLRTLIRLPKAYELARRANRHYECYVDAGRNKVKGKEITVIKPTSLYSTFLARCARAILMIWTLNDIRRHLEQSEPLPSYISPPSLPSRREKLGRLFSRMTNNKSKLNSVSLTPAEVNAQAISLYITILAPRSRSEVQRHLSAFDAARQTYLDSLSRDHYIDLVWVQDFLLKGLANNPPFHRQLRRIDEEMIFALQQSPGFLLSMGSSDQCERSWAWNLAREVVRLRQNEFLIAEWARIIPFPPVEDGLGEEAERAKGELTRGDWRHGGDAALAM